MNINRKINKLSKLKRIGECVRLDLTSRQERAGGQREQGGVVRVNVEMRSKEGSGVSRSRHPSLFSARDSAAAPSQPRF
jgi:hypothetical protein